jgi:hypothetical protein
MEIASQLLDEDIVEITKIPPLLDSKSSNMANTLSYERPPETGVNSNKSPNKLYVSKDE